MPGGEIIGVGTGSAANFFIDELGKIRDRIKGAVASSEATAARLKSHGIPVFDLNSVDRISVYIDAADEITREGAMIKGGGAALTREKIVASVAGKFICIADGSKLVDTLGAFPLPVEVIPMAQAAVARQLATLGGEPRLRMADGKPLITDNGFMILDVLGMKIADPADMEQRINNIVGVVTVGLFARRGGGCRIAGDGERREDARLLTGAHMKKKGPRQSADGLFLWWNAQPGSGAIPFLTGAAAVRNGKNINTL